MRKGMKTFIIVCGILVGTGMILGIIGLVFGGLRGLDMVEEKVPWVSLSGSGIAESETVNTGAFTSVKVDCDMGDVQFVEGDQYAVEMQYDKKGPSPEVDIKSGVLSIDTPSSSPKWLHLNFFTLKNRADTIIRIIYPKETAFDDVKINSDAGKVTINGLSAKSVSLDIDVGSVDVSGINAGYLKVDADMGDVTGNNMNTQGADIKVNMGSLELMGAFAGKTKVDCDMGDCSLITKLSKNSYSVDSRVDMGTCTIDGQDTGSSYINTNSGAKNYMNLSCDAGDLDIRFQ